MLYCIAYHHNSDIALYCLILRSELYYTLSLDCIVLMEKLEFRSEIHWRDFDYISDTISQIQRSFQPVQCNFTLRATWMYGCVNVFERTRAHIYWKSVNDEAGQRTYPQPLFQVFQRKGAKKIKINIQNRGGRGDTIFK